MKSLMTILFRAMYTCTFRDSDTRIDRTLMLLEMVFSLIGIMIGVFLVKYTEIHVNPHNFVWILVPVVMFVSARWVRYYYKKHTEINLMISDLEGRKRDKRLLVLGISILVFAITGMPVISVIVYRLSN